MYIVNNRFIVFQIYNINGSEHPFIYLDKKLITHFVEYHNYITVHYNTSGSFDGSYKVVKNFKLKELLEKF